MARDVTAVRNVPNLIQGVSQQGAQQRRDAQCEAQFDCINSVLEGCVARPPLEVVAKWSTRDHSGTFFTEARHEDEHYLIALAADGIYAVDFEDGTPCSITATWPDASYILAGDKAPKDKFRTLTVDDVTFVANQQVIPQMSGVLSASKVNEALVFVQATNFNSNFDIVLSGPASASGNYLTSDTVVSGTQEVATGLATDINGVNGYVAIAYGSLIHIYRGDGAAFEILTKDAGGDDYMRAFNGDAQSFSKLPARGIPNMVLRVRGESRVSTDDFYVKYEGSVSTGSWVEVVGPGVPINFDAATMPHAVVNVGYRAFEARRLTWSSRIAGDADTAKEPGFVGKGIRDLFWHNRRLGVVRRDGFDVSKPEFPYTFFPDTVQTVLATAPISYTIGGGSKDGVASLDFAVQTGEGLYLWAQRIQHRISSGDQAFKQETVESIPSTSYEFSPNARPLSLGGQLFMTSEVGRFSTLRAIQFQAGRVAGDVDVTSHVGQYVHSGVTKLSGSETLRYVFILSEDEPEVLSLFNYTFDGEQYIQAAVQKWRIPGGPILWHTISSNLLYLVQQRPEGCFLLKVDLTPGRVDGDAGAEYLTRLDLRVTEADVIDITYDASTGTTSFTMPYAPTGSAVKVVLRQDSVSETRGREFPVTLVNGHSVTVKGDLTGKAFYVGQQIVAERTESEFFIRGDQGAEPVDTLTVNRFKVACANTGYSRIEVITPNKATKSYTFPSRVLGTQSATTGSPNIANGDMDAEVGEVSSEVTLRIVNDSFLPSAWQNAAYDFTAVGWKGAK